MAQYVFTGPTDDNRKTSGRQATAAGPFEQNLFKLILLSALAYIVWADKLDIHLGFGDSDDDTELLAENGQSVKASLVADDTENKGKKRKKALASVELPPGSINNLTFAIDPGYARRNGVPHTEVEARIEVLRDYVKRFSPVAVAEMNKYGIPASITLAQGLLESNAGVSKLARQTNNHFGIKCFSRRCGKGHCLNFTDDTHKDFFVKYPNSWGSFRAHSLFLKNSARYGRLFELEPTDYRGWAKGLAKSGYATDKRYADKLIAIIQNLGLERFDR